MLRRSSGASDDRPSELLGSQNDFCNPAPAFGDFLFVEDLVNCRNIGHAFVPLVARKKQDPDKVLFLPGMKGSRPWNGDAVMPRQMTSFFSTARSISDPPGYPNTVSILIAGMVSSSKRASMKSVLTVPVAPHLGGSLALLISEIDLYGTVGSDIKNHRFFDR